MHRHGQGLGGSSSPPLRSMPCRSRNASGCSSTENSPNATPDSSPTACDAPGSSTTRASRTSTSATAAASTRTSSCRSPTGAGSANHLNVLITGSTGVGKTWVACALAHSACPALLPRIHPRRRRAGARRPADQGMSVIEALVRHHEWLYARGDAPPYGFSRERISFAIMLSDAGEAVAVSPLPERSGSAPGPTLCKTPAGNSRRPLHRASYAGRASGGDEPGQRSDSARMDRPPVRDRRRLDRHRPQVLSAPALRMGRRGDWVLGPARRLCHCASRIGDGMREVLASPSRRRGAGGSRASSHIWPSLDAPKGRVGGRRYVTEFDHQSIHHPAKSSGRRARSGGDGIWRTHTGRSPAM